MEGYAVGFLIGVYVVEVRSILGGDKGSGKVLSDGRNVGELEVLGEILGRAIVDIDWS